MKLLKRISIPFLICLPLTAVSNSTPSEFAEMSLEQLFDQTIDEELGESRSQWQVAYQFSQLDLGGYRDGTEDLSRSEVLWGGPGNPRTDKNFPVLPTNIQQQVHLLRVGRALSANTSFSVTVPWIRQSTDHISIVPGYDNFLITSEGLGDIKLALQHRLDVSWSNRLSITARVSLPTGSIDEEGDTPRGPGDQQLPYTMQLGSGTWDFTIGLQWASEDASWQATTKAILRTGENDRDYRLGNHYSAAVSRHFEPRVGFRPYLGLEARVLQKIDGQDDEITIPGAFPYPASITNPDLFGGESVNLLAGVEFKTARGAWNIDLGTPVYQNLNGPQSQNKLKFSLQYSLAI